MKLKLRCLKSVFLVIASRGRLLQLLKGKRPSASLICHISKHFPDGFMVNSCFQSLVACLCKLTDVYFVKYDGRRMIKQDML